MAQRLGGNKRVVNATTAKQNQTKPKLKSLGLLKHYVQAK